MFPLCEMDCTGRNQTAFISVGLYVSYHYYITNQILRNLASILFIFSVLLCFFFFIISQIIIIIITIKEG